MVFSFYSILHRHTQIYSLYIIRYYHGIAVNAHGYLSKHSPPAMNQRAILALFIQLTKKSTHKFILEASLWEFLCCKTQLLHTSRTIFHLTRNRHSDHSPAQNLPHLPGNPPAPPALWESLTAEYIFIKIKAVPLHGERSK